MTKSIGSGRMLPKGKARVMERDLERDVNVYAVLKVCQYFLRPGGSAG